MSHQTIYSNSHTFVILCTLAMNSLLKIRPVAVTVLYIRIQTLWLYPDVHVKGVWARHCSHQVSDVPHDFGRAFCYNPNALVSFMARKETPRRLMDFLTNTCLGPSCLESERRTAVSSSACQTRLFMITLTILNEDFHFVVEAQSMAFPP